MKNATRLKFNKFTEHLATLNGVASAATAFSVAPVVQQKLESRMQESSAFLASINIIGVDDQAGDKVGVGVTGPIASRTNTAAGKVRKPRNVESTETDGYACVQTNFDTQFTYRLLDAWAHRPDFQTLIRDAIIKRQALDRMTIGFNGVSIEADTNLAAHPLLQDVNKGWLQKYRDKAAARVMGSDAAKIKVGSDASAEYKNLDALVYDSIQLLDPWYHGDPDLVAILGRGLMHDKFFPLVNKEQPATETLATDLVISQKRVGGLRAVTVPFFPEGKVLVTTLSNLSIYWQIAARRRHVKDAPEVDAVQNFESSNDDYVVEDYGRGALIDGIELV